jgi:hypothetical protein
LDERPTEPVGPLVQSEQLWSWTWFERPAQAGWKMWCCSCSEKEYRGEMDGMIDGMVIKGSKAADF